MDSQLVWSQPVLTKTTRSSDQQCWNSVGAKNHRYFYLFLVYMVIACSYYTGLSAPLARRVFLKNESVKSKMDLRTPFAQRAETTRWIIVHLGIPNSPVRVLVCVPPGSRNWGRASWNDVVAYLVDWDGYVTALSTLYWVNCTLTFVCRSNNHWIL